ncbi:VPLPA-CTERM protein sorting domain-containing protein [Syntrophus gentianae]|uniref:VPLPA-CTERM protein sorting domain-containing protein n=1 Tax=Syntrophus gentianae TaxID=43775 RepID=A0A1H7WST5_9BACT|nr:VPLPA-CTERM sorting domain-containing protein [Syntrophus gentianae]SEM23999.1 VPLPA-CTERM protein sorting domain-containing protein [Syntrophus gentianae]
MIGKKFLMGAVLSLLILISVSTAQAATVYWTDWTNTTANTVTGTMTIGSETVDVAFSGTYYEVQTSGGTNFWSPNAPYISSTVDNEPPASDIIKLGAGGTVTITFSQAVTNPLLALVSWNGNTVDFGEDVITFLSYGQGYWGNGTPIMNSDNTGFYGSGEVHGVLQLTGTYDSITFTHTGEYWHGLTVGAVDLAPVPIPAALWLFGSGLVGLVGLKRKIRR